MRRPVPSTNSTPSSSGQWPEPIMNALIRAGAPAPLTPEIIDTLPSVMPARKGLATRLSKAFQMVWSGYDGGPFNVSFQARWQAAFHALFANTRIDYEREVGD